MHALGYVEGRNVSIRAWWGEGSGERIQRLGREILRSGPDIVVASGGLSLFALLRARVLLPIVFSLSADPLEGGLIASFARPGAA